MMISRIGRFLVNRCKQQSITPCPLNMHPTVRLTIAHRPLIRFLGKRSWPSTPDVQHPHPAAPEELKKSFGEFLKKFQSPMKAGGNELSSGTNVYQEYWEAPSKYWNSRVKTISEEEVDAILSGGATLH